MTLPTEKDMLELNDTARIDSELLTQLETRNNSLQRYYPQEIDLQFYCSDLAVLACKKYDSESLAKVEEFLDTHGTVAIPIVKGRTVTVDGALREVAFVPATEISVNHGEMSSMLYLRDQIQVASAYMELVLGDSDRYENEGNAGKALLMSALDLMSTPSQLGRFSDVIERGRQAGQVDWPQVSLYFDDLDGMRPNGWRNKQDTWQMLAYLAFDAIERGFVASADLLSAHKQFLGAVVPLLKAVGFPRYESSGSWEEVAAHRSSVMAIETALLHKIRIASKNKQLGFLKDHMSVDFSVILDDLIRKGLGELGARLPGESPDYDKNSVKFRDNDAALVYVLRYDVARLLAESKTPMRANGDRPMQAGAIEDMILDQLETLIDKDTNGMIRYRDDSYQRVNFHTNTVRAVIKNIKRTVQQEAAARGSEIDLDKKQELRGRLTPIGKCATWTHPLGQVSSWAAKCARVSWRDGDAISAARYQEMSARFLNRALSTITGTNQWHAVLGKDDAYEIKKVAAYKLPECYIAYETPKGEVFFAPSPHTPLNWSSAMLKEAVGMLGMSVAEVDASHSKR